MKTSLLSTPAARRRPSRSRQAKDIAVAMVFACGLFALIAFLDGVAQPNDVSPGTAFAATPASRSKAATVPLIATRAAATSATGTRPDAID